MLNDSAFQLLNMMDGNTTVEELISRFDKDSVMSCLSSLATFGLLNTTNDEAGVGKGKRCASNGYPYFALIKLTNRCNLQCSYCYFPQDHETHTMSLETGKNVIQKMYELPTNVPLTLGFHGGEPLLEFEKIMALMEYTNEEIANGSRRVAYQLQTNGTLMTDEIAAALKQNNVWVGLSLDGVTENSNSCRGYRGGGDSSARALNGLDILLDHNVPCSVTSVVTKNNVDHLSEIFRFLVSKGVTAMNFIPVMKRIEDDARFSQEMEISPDQLFEGTIPMVRELMEVHRSGKRKVNVYNIGGIVANLTNRNTIYMCARSPCGGGRGMLTIDVTGDVYACDDFFGIPEYNCGNMNEEEISAIIENPGMKRFRKRTVDSVPVCSQCEWKRICCSGSIPSACSPYGDQRQPSHYCSYYQRIIKYLINLFIEGVPPELLVPTSYSRETQDPAHPQS